MKINVASKNPVKVDAVREALQLYPNLKDYEVFGIETNSGVSEQPKSLEETVQGAINRAKAVFNGCVYSLGIESGLMLVPQTKTGSMEFSACAIYDGINHHLGLSCAFELPVEVTRMIYEKGVDVNEAVYRLGLTTNKKVGSSEGSIGMLTGGRISRKDYTKQAIQMALIHLENKDLY